MTVTYTHKVANARLRGFSSLLIRWKGSVCKLFYKELLIYISLYSAISLMYRFALTGANKTYFEKLCLQFNHYTDLVPISFVLGFYVTIVVGRWWSQFENLPFPDLIMMVVCSCVHGTDERGRLIRRTLLRYLNLAQVLTYRCVSTAVYKRFPTMQHIVTAGIMTPNEYLQYENVKSVNLKYWVPLMWFSNLLSKVRQEGRIYDDMTFKLLMEELRNFRTNCGQLVSYDWISVPLVYTQVVTVAVYMFFTSTLLSRQYLDVSLGYPGHEVDLYVPIFTIGQFFFYMGWLKVAEQLINPFGEDDDDFEVNWCIDRNVEVTMMVADQMYAKHPKLEKDKFWNTDKPDIPYTAAAANHKVEPYMGSTFDMRVDKDSLQCAHDFNSIAKLTTLNEYAKEVSDQNTGLTAVRNDVTNNRAPSTGRQSTSSVPLASQHHFRQPDQYHRSDHHDDEKLPENDNDNVSSPVRRSSSRRKAEHISGDDESVASDTAVEVGDDADDGGDEKENDADDNDSEVENVFSVLQNTKENVGMTEEKTVLNQPRKKIFENPQQFVKRVKKAPKKRSCDFPSSSGFRDNHASSGEFAHSTQWSARTESDEERRNAERRMYLSTRKRRVRNTLLSRRRRPYTTDHIPQLWFHRQRLRHDSTRAASPEVTSLYSETDVCSGHNADSPFSSMLSFATSIPSPRPLRWAFKTKTRNTFEDNASMTSWMPSPSGNDGETTDAFTPSHSPRVLGVAAVNETTQPNYGANADSETLSQQAQAARETGDIATPFTDDLRKRLQVIPNLNPSQATVSSATTRESADSRIQAKNVQKKKGGPKVASSRPFFETPMTKKGISLSKQSSFMMEKVGKKSVGQDGRPFGTKRHKTIDPNEKLSLVVHDSNNNKPDGVLSHLPPVAISKAVRGGGGLLSALKSWNAKRKEVKVKLKESKPKQKTVFRSIQSESDVRKLLSANDEGIQVEDGERDAEMSVEFRKVKNRSKSDEWNLVFSNDNSHTENNISLEAPVARQFLSESFSQTAIRSEKIADDHGDSHTVGMRGSGEITWENECKPPSGIKQCRTARPTSLLINKVAVDLKMQAVPNDDLGDTTRPLEPAKLDLPSTNERVLHINDGDSPKTETATSPSKSPVVWNPNEVVASLSQTHRNSSNGSNNAATAAENPTSDIKSNIVILTPNLENDVSNVTAQSNVDIQGVSVTRKGDDVTTSLDDLTVEEDKGYKSSSDEGYQSATFINKATAGPSRNATKTHFLDVIPENCSEDENRANFLNSTGCNGANNLQVDAEVPSESTDAIPDAIKCPSSTGN